jgi:hypothetical protein
MAISIRGTLTMLERQRQTLQNSLAALVREELEEFLRDDGRLVNGFVSALHRPEVSIYIDFDRDGGEAVAELITRQRLALDAVTAAIERLKQLEDLQEEMGAL